MSEDDTIFTHYNETELIRRHKIWELNNVSENGSPVLCDFYYENNIDTQEISVCSEKKHVIQGIKIFIERNGKYNNYQTFDDLEEQERLKEFLESNEKKSNDLLADKKEKQRQETEQINIQQEELRLKQTKLLKEDEDILADKSEALINYYDKNITPILKKGIYYLSQRKSIGSSGILWLR